MILNVAVTLHRGSSLVLMVAVGVHVDLVDAVVIGWIVGELEVSATEWGSHHVVFGESVAFFIKASYEKGSYITGCFNISCALCSEFFWGQIVFLGVNNTGICSEKWSGVHFCHYLYHRMKNRPSKIRTTETELFKNCPEICHFRPNIMSLRFNFIINESEVNLNSLQT